MKTWIDRMFADAERSLETLVTGAAVAGLIGFLLVVGGVALGR